MNMIKRFGGIRLRRLRSLRFASALSRLVLRYPQIAKIRGPPQILTVEETVLILVSAVETAKHDTKTQENRRALQQHLKKSSPPAIATMKKVIRTRNLRAK